MSDLDTTPPARDREHEPSTTESSTSVDSDAEVDPEALAAQVDLLRDENERLRAAYLRSRQSQYRNTAIALAVLGIVAGIGALVLPDVRDVLLALSATGLFAAVLTYYLSPSRVLTADVGERVYTAGATNLGAIVDELGLQDDRIYVPDESVPASLYVPQQPTYEVPSDHAAGPILVDEQHRGLLLETTGGQLFQAFERGLSGELGTEPTVIAEQVTDALVNQFELVDSTNVDIEAGRVTVAVTNSAFGPVDRFDHPIASLLATAFATGLDRPVRLEVVPDDDRADWLVTCRWEPVANESGQAESGDETPR